ncbi:MAG: ABC transporter ATP-binding protein [Anaerolineales bacterium]|nr:ABC transporter ATP-binding protein [Anaerolineales bacterium]MBX3036663.1 ABC transporter ATP-binding protein [Anaerolineales bacterium]
MNPKPALAVKNLSVVFDENDNKIHALENISFNIHQREFICFLGPSGSGKTTLLRLIANLIKPTSGEVNFMFGHPPKIGMVFQQPNLMPWRSVLDNIKLPLELENDIHAHEKALDMIRLVGLTGFEDSYPRDLSGGMAQRVGLARGLIHEPDLLLLDEPFASLDALTRERMWTELSNLWQAKQKTVIMVTHSINESLFLADRVLVLTQRPGKIKLDMPVDLPRPRKDDVRYTSQFGKLAKKLREAIE